MPENIINTAALEPLFAPWEEPNLHRARVSGDNGEAAIQKGRRPSNIAIANQLRHALSEWRSSDYAGASDTTRELLLHWFERDHLMHNSNGESYEFHYYFCQREAIEALIYLMEVRSLTTLSAITGEFGGSNAELAAQGITPEEDLWPRYAFRVATGAGKTKIMSLAIVWSYFHALRESDSLMAKNFLVIAPNLTVFERLKEDFGDGKIFDRDPLIPPAWKGDWNLSVVLQDEASGAATGGTLYLTNIHRLYEPHKKGKHEAEMYSWMGPAVSKAKALDTGEALRKRVTSHPRLMVLNDEAHHLWDPDSAWMDAMSYLNEAYKKRNSMGLTAQLDFSATPKDKDGNLFKHIICDSPLGEAVDAGIIKVPVIGHVGSLKERADDNAAYKYDEHLRLGYARWVKSDEEWKASGKKPLLFVMCENTKAADEITQRLNTDSTFAEINGKTINLHTNLKGKMKHRKIGGQDTYEFVPDESEISDEDLKQLRKLSRELDENTSPYRCIVSVLMLREGWDVKNVTTIIPLRPYTSSANILPEQTLGRGLRRMTPPGQTNEIVTVVEHEAFIKLYREELALQGLEIAETDVNHIPRTTVSIFPDGNKDFSKLDIQLPKLSAAHKIVPLLEEIPFEEIKQAMVGYPKLSLGTPRDIILDYEGRSLITNEIVETMKINLPLLQSGMGALTFFREELEHACGVRGIHPIVAPLLEKFLEEELFDKKVGLFDERLVARMGDSDVREYIRAVFVPIIRKKTTLTEQRTVAELPMSLTTWKPFQVTHSENHPTLPAEKTLFNLVPCNRQLEVAFADFANRAEDVAAFSKNAGPQALRIDYLANGNRLAFYTPDFFVRTIKGNYYLVETKGRVDLDVPAKARAANEWCKSSSAAGINWKYLYVPEEIFLQFNGNSMEMLEHACAPELRSLVREAETVQPTLPFYQVSTEKKEEFRDQFIQPEDYEKLPERYKRGVDEAVTLFNFLETKNSSFAPCFSPLLGPIDSAARRLISGLLYESVPTSSQDQAQFFEPDYSRLSDRDRTWLRKNGASLKKALVYGSFIMPIGLLSFCLEYSKMTPDLGIEGVFEVIRDKFGKFSNSPFYERVEHIRNFRNTYVAHQSDDAEIVDAAIAKVELKNWISGLAVIHKVGVEL